MADKIVVLNAGVIEQGGSPLELYDNPRNRLVAEFIGSPKMNIVTGALAEAKQATSIGIRPEHLSLSLESGDWKGTVGISEHLGSDTFIRVNADGVQDTMTIRAPGKVRLTRGDTVYLTPEMENLHKFDKEGLRIS